MTRPQDDFFEFINKEWIQRTEIPKDHTSCNNYVILRDKVTDEIDKLISKSDGTLRELYECFMKQEEDFTKVKGLCRLILQSQNISELLGFFNMVNASTIVQVSVSVDTKDSTSYKIHLYQGGLGLPKLYYEKEDMCTGYKKLIDEVLDYVEINKPGLSSVIFNFEKELSKFHLLPEETMDVVKTYNPVTLDELQKKCNYINWASLFGSLDISIHSKIICESVDYITKVDAMLSRQNIKTIKIYLLWCVIRSFSEQCGETLSDIFFDFYGKVLTGQEKQKPLFRRAITLVSGLLSDLVCIEYRKKKYQEYKEVEELVKEIFKEYRVILAGLKWMTKKTKERAMRKLDTLKYKIGFPNKYEDYSRLILDRNVSLVENVIRISVFLNKKMINKYNTKEPVDKELWLMKSYEVNACYIPSFNELIIPSSILKPPFYSRQQSYVENLAGIGTIIGHEILHAFDDHGRHYDEDGNLSDWWTEEDKKLYEAKTKLLIEQYDNYGINGELTIGENFADIVGFEVAINVLKKQPFSDATLNDFFRHYALCNREKVRKEKEELQKHIDPHPTERVRCNGVLSVSPDFNRILNLKKGDEMFIKSEKRFSIY